MRISDWSSDVCSSDLEAAARLLALAPDHPLRPDRPPARRVRQVRPGPQQAARSHHARRRAGPAQGLLVIQPPRHPAGLHEEIRESGYRWDEHTYELQSLMRISYAVFCLK